MTLAIPAVANYRRKRPCGPVEVSQLSPRSVIARAVSVTLTNGEEILAPTSFEVGAGSSLAVVGPSGSGKSTLLDCPTGWRVPTSGSASGLYKVNRAGRVWNCWARRC